MEATTCVFGRLGPIAALALLTVAAGGAAAPESTHGVPRKVLPAPQEVAAAPLLRAHGRYFVEPSGRVVILRGINLTGDSKVPPFLPRMSDADFDRLADLGMNVVRLLFIWEAYEPRPGCYDESYLAAIQAVAAMAWSRGMYVIVDIHQDGFSRYASRGSGDGFPPWAISHRGHRSRPDNGPGCRNWPVLMATDPTTHRSFADFFADAAGVRTRYLAMLHRIAGPFSCTPGVIGYDLMNEPWGDERRDLTPLYGEAASVIRARHPSAILFLEGHVTTNCGLQSKLACPAFGNVAYAPHFYKPSAVLLDRWYGSTLTARRAFANMTAKAGEWGCPLFVGEFGLKAQALHSGEYVGHVYDRLDACLASGAQWNYTPNWSARDKDGWNGEDFTILSPDGAIRANFRPRPYPRHTAGRPAYFEYREACASGPDLVFGWVHDPGRGDTEIFVPGSVFPRGSAISVRPADVVCWRDEARQLLVCRSARPCPVDVRLTAGTPARP